MNVLQKCYTVSCLNSCLKRHKSFANAFPSIKASNSSKIKGTIIEKLITFWQSLFRDYKDVFYESLNDIKGNPKKSIIIFSLLGGVTICWQMNPNDISYRESVIKNSHRVFLLGTAIRNPACVEYLKLIETYYNQGRIQRISLGLCSFIVLNSKSSNTALYRENCEYLQPSYLSMISNNILDVGFLDKWWIMERKMLDYDVNPEEWS